jgi:hypothetical protein
MEYCKINTGEGNGVIHALMVGGIIDQDWIARVWHEIHGGSCTRHGKNLVWIENVEMKSNSQCRRMARYLVGNYLCKQSFERMSWSWNWVCKGFVSKVWKPLLASCSSSTTTEVMYGREVLVRHLSDADFKLAMVKWDFWLSTEVLDVHHHFSGLDNPG